MSKPTSAVKRKYNKGAYHRYEFSVNQDTKLDYLLERYKSNGETSLSELIKKLLCQHFDVEPDEIYVPYRIQRISGQWVQVPNEL
jgi:predicted amidophosphoribosyltransferase